MNKHSFRRWPFLIGTLFLLAAVSQYLYNMYENKKAKAQVEVILQLLHETTPIEDIPENEKGEYARRTAIPNSVEIERFVPDYILNPDMEMPTVKVDGNTYIGMLYFPSLQVELPVMGSWSYPNLRVAPCMYAGSIYTGNAVVAAHNYSCHFGQLFNLTPADRVYFTDIDGNVFLYEVVLQEVLEPTAIEDMTASGYDLSLFTCTLGGASRFTVRCNRL